LRIFTVTWFVVHNVLAPVVSFLPFQTMTLPHISTDNPSICNDAVIASIERLG
jgi:hypothetical protein